MTAPTVSVVVPAYNNAPFIERTIDSVLAQDGVEFELIVADHSSNDSTAEVIDRYSTDPRVTLATTPAGGGAKRNWDRVSRLATGTYIKLLPGDDVLRPGALARQVRLLQAHPGAVLVAARRDLVDVNDKVLMSGWGLKGIAQGVIPGAEAVRRSVRAGTNLFGEPGAVLLRRDVLEQVGYWFDEYPYLIDQATYSRVLLHGDFVPDNEVAAAFRMNKGQWSVALVAQQATQAIGFHNWLRANHPDVVSGGDVLSGNLKARLMARARRLSYRVLERRMS